MPGSKPYLKDLALMLGAASVRIPGVMRTPFPVVLASASPRRQELLKGIFTEFEVLPASLDEDSLIDVDPWVTAQRIAREKALVVSTLRPGALVIAGDTVVAIEVGAKWVQLAKPIDSADAIKMLGILSGQTHTVITGVCVISPKGMTAFTETSRVTFRPLVMHEIEKYVATGSPMDKAGAYGLQDGSQDFIEKVEGPIDNVIGLPMEKLAECLKSMA